MIRFSHIISFFFLKSHKFSIDIEYSSKVEREEDGERGRERGEKGKVKEAANLKQTSYVNINNNMYASLCHLTRQGDIIVPTSHEHFITHFMTFRKSQKARKKIFVSCDVKFIATRFDWNLSAPSGNSLNFTEEWKCLLREYVRIFVKIFGKFHYAPIRWSVSDRILRWIE